MNKLLANHANKKMVYVDVKGSYDVANLIEPLSLQVSIDELTDPMFEVRVQGVKQDYNFYIKNIALNSERDLGKVLLTNNYFINYNLVRHLMVYLSESIQLLQDAGSVKYTHKTLGFKTYNNKKLFLLKNCIGDLDSTYCDDRFKFELGSADEFDKFVTDEIMPTAETQLALVMGLTSVLASDIDDYADVKTIVMNLCGASSTGKTTIAQFIASLWGNAAIGNQSMVRTFNGTTNAIFTAIEGINGVPIILDDATTASYLNKSQLVYQLAQGEARSRMSNYGQEVKQGLPWSGLAVITSEAPLLSSAENRLGLLARVIDTNNIVWTKDANHSSEIKRFIQNNYGHIGSKYVEEYMKLEKSDIKRLFDESREELLAEIKDKDGLTERVVSKLATICSTAKLIKPLLGYEIDVESITKLLVGFEASSVDNRHVALKALDVIKNYISENYKYFNRNSMDCSDWTTTSGKLQGRLEFFGEVMIATLTSQKVREILESNRFYEFETILKYWGDNDAIKKQSGRNTVNIRAFSTRVIQFQLEVNENTLMPWQTAFGNDPTVLGYVQEYNKLQEEKVVDDNDTSKTIVDPNIDFEADSNIIKNVFGEGNGESNEV